MSKTISQQIKAVNGENQVSLSDISDIKVNLIRHKPKEFWAVKFEELPSYINSFITSSMVAFSPLCNMQLSFPEDEKCFSQ